MPTFTLQVKNELHINEKGYMAIDDYALTIKGIRESLASIDVVVDVRIEQTCGCVAYGQNARVSR